MSRRTILLLMLLLVAMGQPLSADEPPLQVELDTSQVPELRQWGEEARALIVQWHARISNLLPTAGFKPPRRVSLTLRKSDQGIGGTSGTHISVSSHWIEKHPEDLGLVFHELVHVIQAYPSAEPGWLTEGIADYLRWGIYEGKEQAWFPRPRKEQGYRQGYQVAGGFLMWLESDKAPGIVKKLNTAMRNRTYSDRIFSVETGQSLDELWHEYSSPTDQ